MNAPGLADSTALFWRTFSVLMLIAFAAMIGVIHVSAAEIARLRVELAAAQKYCPAKPTGIITLTRNEGAFHEPTPCTPRSR